MQKSHKHNWHETTWVNEEGFEITIGEIVDLLKDEIAIDVKLIELSHIKCLSLDDHRVEKAGLSCPSL